MTEIRNCSTCKGIFEYNGLSDICPLCTKEEEKMFDIVHQFLRRRENRASTVQRIVQETGVTTTLLFKWVRKGHLHPSRFPGLGYPCENCGELITTGKICESCTNKLKSQLDAYEASQETIIEMNETYLAHGKMTREDKFNT
ncbi:hypothetical protein QTL97_08320 [Sporosarcina thermotolerans]|uniref:Flagellar protein n=1 Tax=Sporosarcina thermotolerans TaxID=633404 RepID=A0AAW9ACS2_9BACL|nr:TIGR03826 family flagellar region protein [Sporosarcina thermotolerans]MDW0116936.1 hypothetical protein [Sporosarcina thermotolerans]WHT47948.1 hypothetical protein QNH10_18045 [Sporosarcina thermotolerans]